MTDKSLTPMKATLLDDDAFRLLALPYGGPIPYPGAPRGADYDRQWMTERTDWGDVPKWVPVTWHHGQDPWSHLAAADPHEVVGKAGELEFDDDGGWVKVWLDAGRRRTRLIKALAEAAETDPEVGIYGSSEGIPGSGRLRRPGKADIERWRPKVPGEITQWHYNGQTLSTSPQNTASILTPVKATLEDLASDDLAPTAQFFDDLSAFLDSLAPSPETAKAGRVLAGRNEARLLQVREHIDEAYYDPKRRRAALSLLDDVLREMERYLQPDS